MEKNKICVVGAGRWGTNHINTLYDMGALGGIVEYDIKNHFHIDNQLSEVQVFKKIEESFGKFKGYTIATPAETHFKIAKKIISNGYHVLIEKPMTLNSDDAIELVEMAKEKNVNLMVGHLLLFHPAISKIKKMIDNQEIGKLQYIYSNRLNLGEIRSEENVFWSLAPHDISILQFLTNSYPIKTYATGSSFIQRGIHDTTLTIFDYPNNVKAHVYVSWLHPFKEHRLVVIGSEGMISFEDSKESKPLKFYKKKYIVNNEIPEKKDGEEVLLDYENTPPLKLEMEYFVNHMDGNKPINISNGESGLDVVKILEDTSRCIA